MTLRIRRWFVSSILVATWAALACGADQPKLRGYPDPLPEDASYETVVKSQPFPLMKYPVTIIGAAFHPEEVHVTPSGELILPYTEIWKGLCVATLAGTRPADGAPGQPTAMLPVEAMNWRLVDGYMPGVENQWTIGDVELRQLAFATSGGIFESATGQEPLVALVRYTLTNKASAPREAVLAIQFGQAYGGLSMKTVPPVYPQELSFAAPYVRQKDGKVVACVLTKDAAVSFKPLGPAPEASPTNYTLVNEKAESVKGPEHAVDVERNGDALTIGSWPSPAGADLFVEASKTHGSGMVVDVRVATPDGTVTPVGTLDRTRFSVKAVAVEDFIFPGEHSAALPWAALAKSLPQGKSKIVLRCRIASGAAGKENGVASWEPIVLFARPGTTPKFKNVGSRYSDENRLSFTIPLAPGESKNVELAVPYFPLPADVGMQLVGLHVDKKLANFRRYWSRELTCNADFVVPEKRVRDSYRACLANNLILIDRDPKSGVLMPHPDASGYESVWAGDGSVSMQALDRMGYHKEVESMFDYFLARQGREKPEGDVLSTEGFLSGDVDLRWMNQNGFILWAMAEHYKLTHDDAWLHKVAPQMIRGCAWIARERARTKVLKNGQKVKHYGLLPKGRPSDLYIWDNWYWTDTYSYMGLRGTADVLPAAGLKSYADELAAEADDYKACILASIERSIDPKIKPPFLPPTPYRVGPPTHAFSDEYWYAISSPIYMVEAGLLDARDERIGGTAYWLEKDGMATGLPLLGVGSIDPYYVYNQSLTQLLRGEPAKFAWTLYSLSAYGMAQGVYATIEGHNLLTGFNSETWEANRQPHMHSNSRYIDLVRIALVLEDGDTLHLMAGAPRGWLADGEKIEVRRAASYFGPVNFTAQSRVASGEIAVDVEPTSWKAPKLVIHVRPPTKYGKIKSVKLNGEDWKDFDGDAVTLPRLDKKMTVVCGF
jgi:hypothetical protein